MSDFDGDIDLDAAIVADEPTVADEVQPVDENTIEQSIAKAFDQVEGQAGENGQPRDPMGRFAAKQAEDAAKADAAKVEPETQAAPQVGAMPASWGRDKAELWAKTPPEVQAFIVQREQQVSEGFKQYEGLAEYAELAQRNGGSLKQTLATVKELDDLVSSDPLRGFAEIMSRIGYDPAKVARAFLGLQDDGTISQQQAYQPPQIDPAIQRTIQQLQGEVQSLRLQPYQQQVEAFASDPANKYFDKLIPQIKALIASDKGLSLKDAYDRACWADPQVRSELLQQQQAPVIKAQTLAKSTQTAERASRGLSPSGSAPVKVPPKSMSIEDSIAAAFAQHA